MAMSQEIEILEQALLAQWAHFGTSTEGGLEDDGDLIWTDSPFGYLPYNAVVKTQISGDAAERIHRQVEHFAKRDAHFLWVVNPTASPSHLEELLIKEGLSLLPREIGMIAEVSNEGERPSWEHRGVNYKLAANPEDIADFEEVTMVYWDLPDEARDYVHSFTWRAFEAGDCGLFFLAFRGSEPVGKAYLSLRGHPGTSSLWAVFVKPEARGLGIGSHLTRLALWHAANIGRNQVVLMSTEMGRSVYQRYGFSEICEMPVYSDTAVFTTLQGV